MSQEREKVLMQYLEAIGSGERNIDYSGLTWDELIALAKEIHQEILLWEGQHVLIQAEINNRISKGMAA